MADLINQNNLGANNNTLNAGSAGSNSNNLRPSKPFGLNVRVPERTIKQICDCRRSY